MAKERRPSVVPIYAVGVTWLIWSLVLPLYLPLHWFGAAAASLAVYVLGRSLIWKDRVLIVPDGPEPKEPEAPAQEETGGDPEIAALKKERERALSEMRRLNDNIEDAVISAQIDRLEEVTGKILDYVAQHPDKRPQIRKFLNYYLPTTLKLLNAYDRMGSAGVSGANIDGTMGKIETMMETIVAAFDRQLDALFGDEALDIATDITVLEQMLAGEGLSGSEFETKSE